MEIRVRKISGDLADVSVRLPDATINYGCLSKDEAKELASSLVIGVYHLCRFALGDNADVAESVDKLLISLGEIVRHERG